MRLEERLKKIADMVPLGAKIADVGTDHAYLPLFLVKEGKVDYAVASDINKGPYLAAKETINKSNLAPDLKDKISIRLGDGLKTLVKGETDVLIIAGMGGITIIDILKDNPDITESFKKMILQPMNAAEKLRQYLCENKWQITAEDLVLRKHQGNTIYQIIAFEKSETTSVKIDPVFYEIGPLLFANKHPLLKLFISEQISSLKKIVLSLEKSDLTKSSEKHSELITQIKNLEDKLACL